MQYSVFPTLAGNCHELHMHLSKFFCGNMPGFLATFRSRNLLFCLELSLSPSYTGGFSLHRCRRESNLKSSGCLFQVNCSWQFPFKKTCMRHFLKLRHNYTYTCSCRLPNNKLLWMIACIKKHFTCLNELTCIVMFCFLKAAISNAKSLEEVKKLEMLLKTGHVPDSESKTDQDETMVVDGT